MSDLSGREHQIIVAAAQGLTDKEIAKKYGVQLGTIRTYWERIRTKLGVANRAEAVARLMSQLYEEKSRQERKFEHMVRMVVESIPDFAIFVSDSQGIVQSWNLGVRNLFGYEEQEWIGQSGEIIFTKEDRAKRMHFHEIESAITLGRANDQRWHVRKDGSQFWGSGYSSAALDDDGNLVGIVKVVRDHTNLDNSKVQLPPEDVRPHLPESG